MTDTEFGVGIPATKIDWQSVADAANDCDVTVSVPGGTEKTFTCNGVAFGTDSHKRNITKLLSSMNGNVMYANGKYYIQAGAFDAASESLTENDLRGPVSIKTSVERSSRFNTIKPIYASPSDNYKMMELPPVTVGNLATSRDNGEVLEKQVQFPFTNRSYMAQRLAHQQVNRSSDQRVLTFPANLKGMRIKVGDRVQVTLSEFGYTNKVFQCIGWRFGEGDAGGVDLTLIEDTASRYTAPASGFYSQKTNDGTINSGFPGVSAPQSLTATGAEKRITVAWTNPVPASSFSRIYVYGGNSNVFASHDKVWQVNTETITEELASGTTRYYWVRAVKYGDGATSGNSALVGPASATASTITADSVEWTDVDNRAIGIGQSGDALTLTGVDTDNSTATGQGISESGINQGVSLTQTSGGVTFNQGGSIKTTGKDDELDTTPGFFLGYNSSLSTPAYTFAVGDATNSMIWTGEKLKVKGSAEVDSLIVNNNFQLLGESFVAGAVRDGSITGDMLDQSAINRILGSVATATGSTNGDYKSGSGSFTSSGGNIVLGSSGNLFDHGNLPVEVEANFSTSWFSTTNYNTSSTTSGGTIRLDFEVSTDGNTYTSVHNNPSINIAKYDLSGYYGTPYFAYYIYHDETYTVTTNATGTGADLQNGVDVYFRCSISAVGSPVTGQTVAFTFQANEGVKPADTVTGSLTVTGDLTVQGTTTTVNSATLDVADKNITVNYASGDSSSTADGAGITIQDAVDANTDATILWDQTNSEFDFSHDINLNTKKIRASMFHAGNPNTYFIKAEAAPGDAISVSGNITATGSVNGTTISAGGTTIVDVSRNLTNIGSITSGAVTVDGEVSVAPSTGTAKVRLTSLGTGSEVFSINGQRPGVSNTGFAIRNETDSRNDFMLDGDGNATFANLVGINKGVNSAVALSVGADSTATNSYALEVCNSSANTRFLVDGVGNAFFAKTDNSYAMKWDATNGRLGIGRTDQTYGLDVRHTGSALARFVSSSDDALVRIIANNYGTEADARLFLGENDTYGMTLEYDGVANIGYIGMNDNVDPTGSYSKRIQFPRGNTHTAFMAGRVGVGVASPSSDMHVNSSGGGVLMLSRTYSSTNGDVGYIQFGNLNWDSNLAEIKATQDNSNTAAFLSFRTQPNGGSTTERLRIGSRGELQLGGTSNAGFVDFDGTSLQLNTQRNPNTGAFVNTSRAHAGITLRGGDGSSTIKFYTASSNNTTATEHLEIDHGGNLILSGGSRIGKDYTYLKSDSSTTASLTLRKDSTAADSIDFLQLRNDGNALIAKINGSGQILVNEVHLNDTNTKLQEGGGNSARVQSNYGYIDIGAQNTSYCHIQTDRNQFYFNRKIIVDSGVVASYNEDLVLRRADNSNYQMSLSTSTAAFTVDITTPGVYDASNTAYFINPADTTTSGKFRRFVQIGDSSTYGSNSGSWGSRLNVTDDIHARIDVGQDSDNMLSRWTAHTGQSSVYFGTYTNHDLTIVRNGSTAIFVGNGYIRTPIQYDPDDTTYYVDPSSNSRMSRLLVGDTGSYIRIGDTGEGANSSVARIRTNSSGDLFLDQKDGRHIYLSWWTGGSARVFSEAGAQFPIYYDRNNTGYFANPADVSNMAEIISRQFRVDAGDGRGLRFWDSDNYKIYMSASSHSVWGGRVDGETTSDYNMYFKMQAGTNRGFVFRNNTNSVAGIDASGNARFEGNVIAYSSSDRKLKSSIRPIENALEKVCSLNGYEFQWNDKQTIHEVGKADIGVIAQEVLEQFPTVVAERTTADGDTHLGVDYERLVPALIGAIRELNDEIQKLKKKIK